MQPKSQVGIALDYLSSEEDPDQEYQLSTAYEIERAMYEVAIVLGIIASVYTIRKFTHCCKENRCAAARLISYKISLSVADALILFWYGGDALCRLYKFIATFAFYLTGNMQVLIAFDRLVTMTHLTEVHVKEEKGYNTRLFLMVAWALALFSSVPQLFIFKVVYVNEDADCPQCTSIWNEYTVLLDREGERRASARNSAENTSMIPSFNTSSIRDEWIRMQELEKMYNILHISMMCIIPYLFELVLYALIVSYLSDATKGEFSGFRRFAYKKILRTCRPDKRENIASKDAESCPVLEMEDVSSGSSKMILHRRRSKSLGSSPTRECGTNRPDNPTEQQLECPSRRVSIAVATRAARLEVHDSRVLRTRRATHPPRRVNELISNGTDAPWVQTVATVRRNAKRKAFLMLSFNLIFWLPYCFHAIASSIVEMNYFQFQFACALVGGERAGGIERAQTVGRGQGGETQVDQEIGSQHRKRLKSILLAKKIDYRVSQRDNLLKFVSQLHWCMGADRFKGVVSYGFYKGGFTTTKPAPFESPKDYMFGSGSMAACDNCSSLSCTKCSRCEKPHCFHCFWIKLHRSYNSTPGAKLSKNYLFPEFSTRRRLEPTNDLSQLGSRIGRIYGASRFTAVWERKSKNVGNPDAVYLLLSNGGTLSTLWHPAEQDSDQEYHLPLAYEIERAMYEVAIVVGIFVSAYTLCKFSRCYKENRSVAARLLSYKISLSVADALILFVYAPTQAVWITTFWWYGGDALCRLYKFISAFAFYLTGHMQVLIAFDRLVTMSHLTEVRAKGAKNYNTRLCLTVAWMLALVPSLPQLFIFKLTYVNGNDDCPQCTSIWAVSRLFFCLILQRMNTAYSSKLSAHARTRQVNRIRHTDAGMCEGMRNEETDCSICKADSLTFQIYNIVHISMICIIPYSLELILYALIISILAEARKGEFSGFRRFVYKFARSLEKANISSNCSNAILKCDRSRSLDSSPTRDSGMQRNDDQGLPARLLRSDAAGAEKPALAVYDSALLHASQRRATYPPRSVKNPYGAIAPWVRTLNTVRRNAKRKALLMLSFNLIFWLPYCFHAIASSFVELNYFQFQFACALVVFNAITNILL
ncbi:hypothetical protein PRIPAC_81035 [Pristionchus pacificus]|uniref:G protein-coupled receptor n=1 Tax=Pristionchus pacificus TaxID=54126 RepID=A0A2A6CNS3_PRIPA|nr:hypothetical protein PRIPAC_81035 [Pristionchus pacificus]|eukprot:PDM79748.1 G protein-coupled receptor [Pristionchus pacificus]